MATGQNLVEAIIGKQSLMDLSDCPSVPIQIGKAVYGDYQDDTGSGTIIKHDENMQKQIETVLGIGGMTSETAVWHFLLSPVHHFVVIPWYHFSTPYWVYTVFMAYEDAYTLGEYVNGTGKAPPTGGKGYKTVWSYNELSTMLSELLTSGTAWEEYLGRVGKNQATKITCWKYKLLSVDTAIANVTKY